MTLATLVVYGRYWYDFLTLAWVIGFFLIEMVLLFRNSLLGWAMTAKCLAVAAVFAYALTMPPVVLPPENVSIGAFLVRSVLIAVLGAVIVILLWMRWRRETVVVGREGKLPGADAAKVRDQVATNRETALDVREDAAIDRELMATGREGDVASREGDATVREVAVSDRESGGTSQ